MTCNPSGEQVPKKTQVEFISHDIQSIYSADLSDAT